MGYGGMCGVWGHLWVCRCVSVVDVWVEFKDKMWGIGGDLK